MSLFMLLLNYLVGGLLCLVIVVIAGMCLRPEFLHYQQKTFSDRLFLHLLKRNYNAARCAVAGVVMGGVLSYFGLPVLGLGLGLWCFYLTWMFLTCPIHIFNHKVRKPGVFFNIPKGPGNTSVH